ncbi:thiamine pyrophosphate-dependent dehydrogenase E1 component subunit alpha [Halorubellus sp. JP-L1]|uniref:thiamine pyrophosphate-dependent dehydrogenase E1 component subunit alpha n=1 Tax=Halorubellus sp. JP-L1 TaxID=2715753 RepID=UPI0014095687|nr:thiamine pyrophosphate-dependent dehydrogenase E1 component subunit alpha [Halorubellus sp. JP-L1]NHN42519.1 thiamine pyrophosphate-dependent dehydrogenase E1 component subunit alpha [Halorubellus sp. JP-L1]
MPEIDIGSPDGRREALRTMLLVREFENRVRDRFADNEIPGFVHLSQGQEAVAAGACGALADDDYITSTHRAHGHSLAKGLEPDRLLAELYGKEAGYCGGRGGSMHVSDLERGMLGAQPIVGASVPLGTGAGITAQLEDADWCAVAFCGDGSVAAGQVHEGINLAATWELPVVYVIENNQYSEGMVFDEQHNVEDLADMAASYGIPGEIVDGQDVEAVHETVSAARERALAGEGPTLVEAKTYRYRGHFEGDEEPYRSQEEVEEWIAERDPIENYAEVLAERGELSIDELEAMRADVEATMDAAVQFARDADEPAPEDAYDDVFVDPAPDVERFRERMETDGGQDGGAGR